MILQSSCACNFKVVFYVEGVCVLLILACWSWWYKQMPIRYFLYFEVENKLIIMAYFQWKLLSHTWPFSPFIPNRSKGSNGESLIDERGRGPDVFRRRPSFRSSVLSEKMKKIYNQQPNKCHLMQLTFHSFLYNRAMRKIWRMEPSAIPTLSVHP